MPRKTLKQRREQPTEDKINRIRKILDEYGTGAGKEPDDVMEKLIENLEEVDKYSIIPGEYCTFFYFAKTPNIVYDQHPLVGITDVFSWGFRGINYHWPNIRQYTFDEIPGGIYKIYDGEITDARKLSFKKFNY